MGHNKCQDARALEELCKKCLDEYDDLNRIADAIPGDGPIDYVPTCNSVPIKQEGKKFDNGKPPMELLSNQALVEIAKVFGKGAEKYGRYNYKNGIAWTRIIGAAYRHLGAFNSGEDLDPETGLSHIAHLGCCVVMLLDYINDHPELDDRYKAKKPT
jgi:hypothetical protein